MNEWIMLILMYVAPRFTKCKDVSYEFLGHSVANSSSNSLSFAEVSYKIYYKTCYLVLTLVIKPLRNPEKVKV